MSTRKKQLSLMDTMKVAFNATMRAARSTTSLTRKVANGTAKFALRTLLLPVTASVNTFIFKTRLKFPWIRGKIMNRVRTLTKGTMGQQLFGPKPNPLYKPLEKLVPVVLDDLQECLRQGKLIHAMKWLPDIKPILEIFMKTSRTEIEKMSGKSTAKKWVEKTRFLLKKNPDLFKRFVPKEFQVDRKEPVDILFDFKQAYEEKKKFGIKMNGSVFNRGIGIVDVVGPMYSQDMEYIYLTDSKDAKEILKWIHDTQEAFIHNDVNALNAILERLTGHTEDPILQPIFEIARFIGTHFKFIVE